MSSLLKDVDSPMNEGPAALRRYRGRFAPTPSGPLHLGSLLTALASYLDARHHGGEWLLRIDDLDRPRCVPGADHVILRQLEAHGLFWDGAPRCQRQHQDEYRARLADLQQRGRLYACRCTRAELATGALAGPDGPVYPGTCRALRLPSGGHALRLASTPGTQTYADLLCGVQRRDRDTQIGDFVVLRRDGIIGYHLACAVDEHAQAITTVMRGGDLVGATFAQLLLMEVWEQPAPQYAHLPLLVDREGRKLSKQNHAAPLDARRAGHNLWQCLKCLAQTPPDELQHESPAALLAWAIPRWQRPPLASIGSSLLEPDAQVWHDAAQQ